MGRTTGVYAIHWRQRDEERELTMYQRPSNSETESRPSSGQEKKINIQSHCYKQADISPDEYSGQIQFIIQTTGKIKIKKTD